MQPLGLTKQGRTVVRPWCLHPIYLACQAPAFDKPAGPQPLGVTQDRLVEGVSVNLLALWGTHQNVVAFNTYFK